MNHPFTMRPESMPQETLTYAECLKRAHEHLWIVQSSRALNGTGCPGGRSDAKQKRLDKLRADLRALVADWLAEDAARQRARETGMTQAQAAAIVGMDQSSVSKQETAQATDISNMKNHKANNPKDQRVKLSKKDEALHPETKHGKTPGNQYTGQKRESEIISFSVDTAAKVGVSDRSIQQEVQIANHLSEEVKETNP